MQNTNKLIAIFLQCHDFYVAFENYMDQKGLNTNIKANHTQTSTRLHPSEIMTIVIFYHMAGFKCFKYYYNQYICAGLKSYFPAAPSYSRFTELAKQVNLPLYMFVAMQGLLHNSSNCYIDSTKLAVCDNHRIHQHKVFKGLAQRGKTSMGWFYGLKLHVIINDKGALISFCFSAGNVSDNNKEIVGYLCRYLQNGVKVFGDAGYVSQNLFDMLYKQGITLITKIRKNMKNKLLTLKDKWLLKKRTLVETAIDLWKHIGDLWHTRHRSVDNAFNNVLACLAAYHFNDHKPSIKMSKKQYLLQLLN